MARGLIHATVACLLVLWVARGVDVVSAEMGSDRPHIGPGSVAAGRRHSVVALPDGRVSAWGSGRRGQIGDGALADRWLPTNVPKLDGIVAVAAGAAHTIAVTREGDVYAWGANTFGRLGDGTRIRRSTPVRIRGITNVITVAAGRAHTLALSADGRVFAWGRNNDGQLGIGSKVNSLVPVRLRDLSDVVAIAAGDTHSLAVTRSGQLFAWGSNQFSMLGDGTVKDRARPVLVRLNDVVAVAGGAAHSVALLRNGSVYSWGRGANGELGTGSTRVAARPVLVPGVKATAIAAGRYFSAAVRDDGRVVTWGANESGQLGDRTTIRRLRPVVVEAVSEAVTIALGDAHAIAVTRTGDVRTWGAGDSGQLGNGATADRAVASEIISDIPDWGTHPDDTEEPSDTVPPSITVSTSPPFTTGWMTTPVTVTFQCADDVAVASCSAPITVATDGARQIVGTAVDLAGNQASITVSVNLDLNPPVLTITEPADHSAIDADAVEVFGRAADLASGLVAAWCNSSQAQIVDGVVRCVVPLHPGRNEIVLHALDGVGRNSSAAISVTRAGAGVALTLTPATRAMTVAETATLSLRDESGMPVEHAVWSTSDDDVVAISASDPPLLTAAGIGSVTITAEKNGVSVTASIEVSAALAAGATRWTLPPLPGFTSERPLFTHRVDASVPHMFAVETEQWDTAMLRAVTSDGEVLWQMHSPGTPVMGDSFGGVLSVVFNGDGNPNAYARIGGGSISAWRYQSAGELGRPAQAPDGTIYAIEHLPGGMTSDGQQVLDKYGIVIDGATGRLISRTLFRRESVAFTANWDGMVIEADPPFTCRSTYDDWEPDTVDPVVGSDGRGYFVVRRHQIHLRADCVLPFLSRPDRTIEMGIDLVVLSPDAAPQSVTLYSTSCVGASGTRLPCDLPVRAVQVMPDGIGGTIVTWERGTQMVGASVFVQRSMTRVDAEGAIAERQVPPRFSMELMGQAGMALAHDGETGWRSMNVISGDIKWTNPLPGLGVLAARPDNGLAALDFVSGELKMLDVNGSVESTQPFGLDWRAVQQSGDWIGLRGNHITAVVGDFADATRWRATSGNAQGQLSPGHPGVGIFAKTHLALEPFPFDLVRIRHVSIRVAPYRWQSWVEKGIELKGTDEFGNGFFTLGAGSNSTDTTLSCMGTLVSGINRTNDYLVPPWDSLEKLAYPHSIEDALIQSLLDTRAAYKNDLPYACRPEANPGYFNSNSFARGLLDAVGLPTPRLPARFPGLVLGWLSPVPLSKFQ